MVLIGREARIHLSNASARPNRTRRPKRPAFRIRAVHQESDGTYGAVKFTAELRETSGEAVNHKRAARIMRVFRIEGALQRVEVDDGYRGLANEFPGQVSAPSRRPKNLHADADTAPLADRLGGTVKGESGRAG